MDIERCWRTIQMEIINIDNRRPDDYDLLLRCLVMVADNVVDEFKKSREFHKTNDSTFRFWTYVPCVERGASTVIIRWRKYSGRGRYSDPVATSVLVNHRIPMSRFPKTTKAERVAIAHAEAKFSRIRKIGEHLIMIGQAHNAIVDITGARSLKEDKLLKKRSRREDEQVGEGFENTTVNETIEFTEEERDAWRIKHGLPPRYS